MTISPPSATRRASCAGPSPPPESSPARHDVGDAGGGKFGDRRVTPNKAEHVDAIFRAKARQQASDRASGTVLHEPVAALKAKVGQYHLGAERHGDELASGLIVNAIGHGACVPRIDQVMVGPGLLAAADHALPDLEVLDPGAEFLYHAERLRAADRRQRRLDAIRARHGHQVMSVDGGQDHPDPRLPRPGRRPLTLGKGQHLGRIAEPFEYNAVHEQSLLLKQFFN
jgi:hypothetical protein